MRKLLAIAAVFVTLNASSALAQGRDYISDLDTDQDGAISRAEFDVMQTDHFDRQDLDHDGQLTAQEARRGVALSREQYAAQAFGVFDAADVNNDAALTGDEIASLRALVAAPAPAANALSDAEMATRAIMEPDVCYVGNHDGVVSRDEFAATAANHFGRQDVNGDGEINGEERGRPGGPRTRDAYVADALNVFDAMDTNHDGQHASDELTRMRDLVMPTVRRVREGGWRSGCGG